MGGKIDCYLDLGEFHNVYPLSYPFNSSHPGPANH